MSSDLAQADVIRLLELVLGEPDPELARLCVQVADRVDVSVASVADLIELPAHATRTGVVDALTELCGYGCVDLALRLTRHSSPTLRVAAMQSLEGIDDPRIARALRTAPDDPEPEVQRILEQVRASLDRSDVPRRVPQKPTALTVSEAPVARLLVGKVQSTDIPQVRELRSSALATVRQAAQRWLDRRAINLIATLRTTPSVEALKALEDLRDSRAVRYLETAGLHTNPDIGAAQTHLLGSLRKEAAVKVLLKWLAQPSGLESTLWRGLVDSGLVAVPLVIGVLPTLCVGTRLTGARLVGPDWPRAILLKLLDDPSRQVRLATVTTLASTFDRPHSVTDAQMVIELLAGVAAGANAQSADDQHIAEVARRGVTAGKQKPSSYAQSRLGELLDGVLNAEKPPTLTHGYDWSGRIVTPDRISFTVTSPLTVAPAEIFVLSVWAHTEGQRDAVLSHARREQGRAVRVASRGPVPVPHDTLLTIRVRIPAFGMKGDDAIYWPAETGISSTSFVVKVPTDAPRGPVAGSLRVYMGSLRITRLELLLEVGHTTAGFRRARLRERRVRSGFASYASADRDEVMARIQGMLKMAPALDIFVDALSLRSGERWEERLKYEIAARDVLYLFWSLAASRSNMVDHEWRFSLQERGLDFIDPVPLQPPSIVPPPPELASLHFSDWTLAFKR
jgi:hypothetical protein